MSGSPLAELTPRPTTGESNAPLAALPMPLSDVAASVSEMGDAVARGLATIGRATTATGVYHAVCALALRLPSVGGVAILRQDDRGLLGVAYAPPTMPISTARLAPAAASLHHRWIGVNERSAPATEARPFGADGHPDVLVVPFVHDDRLLGALVLDGKDGRLPGATKAERITAAAIGVAASQALEAASLRQRLERAVSRGEHDAALAAERKRISHELHDGPTQELALAGIILDRLIVYLGEDRVGAEDARQARDLIDRSIQGMRRTLTQLRAWAPEGLSATGPLRDLLAELEPGPDTPDLEVDFSHISGLNLSPEVERALVGIVREALHNVRKHADAESVQLEVRRAGHEVEIAVVDDGVGFDGMSQAGHFGLEQIRELAEGMGGRVEIGSLPGIGTSVRAWLPLPGRDPVDRAELAWADGLELDWAEAIPRPASSSPTERRAPGVPTNARVRLGKEGLRWTRQ